MAKTPVSDERDPLLGISGREVVERLDQRDEPLDLEVEDGIRVAIDRGNSLALVGRIFVDGKVIPPRYEDEDVSLLLRNIAEGIRTTARAARARRRAARE